MKNLILLSLVALSLGGCWEKEPVKDKAYYLAHRDELETANRECRDTGKVATDETCMRLGVIKTEILKEEVGARIKAR